MLQFKWQLLFLAFLFYENVKTESVPNQRIINGFHAVPKQFPYQVLLNKLSNDGWLPWCGGVIISNRIVLTAAHCVDNDIGPVKIYFGAVDRSNDREIGQQHLIVDRRNIVVHPEYEFFQVINDIALIKLPADLQFDEYIQPAKLPDPTKLYENESGVVSGWGMTSILKTELPYQLMYYNVTVLSNEECKPILLKDLPSNIFASSYICLKPSESTTYKGDSGGPLAIRNDDGSSTLLGLTSFGISGGKIYRPQVYTRVSSFLKWIKQYE